MSDEITSELRGLAEDINWTEIVDHIDLLADPIAVDGEWLDAWHAAFDAACDRVDGKEDDMTLKCRWCGREVTRLVRIGLIDISSGRTFSKWVCEKCRESL